MKKILFILIISYSFSYADSILGTRCVKYFTYLKDFPSTGITSIELRYSDNDELKYIPWSQSTWDFLHQSYDKFEFTIDGYCRTKTNKNLILGMENSNFQLLMGLTGLLTAFLITSLISRRF